MRGSKQKCCVLLLDDKFKKNKSGDFFGKKSILLTLTMPILPCLVLFKSLDDIKQNNIKIVYFIDILFVTPHQNHVHAHNKKD